MVAALVLTGDLDDGVLRIVEVEVQIDAGSHPRQLAVDERYEVTLGEDPGVGTDVIGGEQIFRVRHRKTGELDLLEGFRHRRVEADYLEIAQS